MTPDERTELENKLATLKLVGRKPEQIEMLMRKEIMRRDYPVAIVRFPDGEVRLVYQDE